MLDDEERECERHIADLRCRIARLKENSPRSGSELLTSAEIIELLQQTLESWQEREKTLVERHKHQ
jgi:hypothetical protein